MLLASTPCTRQPACRFGMYYNPTRIVIPARTGPLPVLPGSFEHHPLLRLKRFQGKELRANRGLPTPRPRDAGPCRCFPVSNCPGVRRVTGFATHKLQTRRRVHSGEFIFGCLIDYTFGTRYAKSIWIWSHFRRHLTHRYRAVVPGRLEAEEYHLTCITNMHSILHPTFLCVLCSFNRVDNVFHILAVCST